MKEKAKSKITVGLLACFLILVFMPPLVQATTTVPSSTHFAMPSYGTDFNFYTEQTFNDVYLESNANATYPEYWFFTTTSDTVFGWQSENVNFTASHIYSSPDYVQFYPYGAGVVHFYCGPLGEPTQYVGAATHSYSATTNVASVSVTGGNVVTLQWGTPSPTPTPSAALSLTINQPTATTYSTSNVLISLTATGGTVDKVWFNVMNGSNWVYPSAIVYTSPNQMNGYTNGSYTLYAYANNTAGASASATVSFTVALTDIQPTIPTISIGKPQNTTYIVNTILVQLSSTNANAVWYNIKNGSSWIYTYNQTYTSSVSRTGFSNGTYQFYAFAANNQGGSASASVVFTIGASSDVVLPVLNLDNFWLFLYEGNFLGFMQAYLIGVFFNLETAIALIVMLFMVPIYLRTKSLMLLCILWIMLGGFFIAAIPLASGVAVLFMALGIGGLIFRLFRHSTN